VLPKPVVQPAGRAGHHLLPLILLLFRDLLWPSIADLRCLDLDQASRRLATLHAVGSFFFSAAAPALAITFADSLA
jgi:hypothetical protein